MIVEAMEILLAIVGALMLVYYYLTSTYNYWRKRGVPGPTPLPIFGTVKDIILGKYSLGSYLKVVYDEYPNEPMVGIFIRREPVLLLNDMDLIKLMLIKDFKSFVNRGLEMHEKYEPLTGHLFNLEAERWRPLRTKLTPVFTSGKLKKMFYLLSACANQLDSYLEQENGKSVDIRDICAKFTTDVIGVCAFGLQANALAEDESTFRRMGRKIFDSNWRNSLKFRLRTFVTPLYNLVGRWLVDQEVTDFFINLTRDTMHYRKQYNVIRHDFIDLLRTIKDESDKIGDYTMTDSFMAAQLFVFFIAGFETSSSTMSNCLFELAHNHAVRDRLHEEINQQLGKTNGEITYDGIKSMEYLDRVVNETLRKYPPVPLIMRKTTMPYKFPGTKVSVPIGTKVWIPIFAIQRDPKYYPEPDVFDPDRFSEEAIGNRPPMAFLPFGDGPRNCIGLRFGRMQSKVGLVKILQKYTVDVCEKTQSFVVSPHSFLLTPRNGVFVKIIKTDA